MYYQRRRYSRTYRARKKAKDFAKKKGKSGLPTFGTRLQVVRGKALKTTGNKYKTDFFKDKYGRIRSKAASAAAKKQKNLGKFLDKEYRFGGGKNKKKSKRKSSKKKSKRRSRSR
ncbi:MAG: hypothetical protein CMB64_04000 [Euryarchaeota archaeon]|nr:hypothetical protein [Euryarchaeota archaeon]